MYRQGFQLYFGSSKVALPTTHCRAFALRDLRIALRGLHFKADRLLVEIHTNHIPRDWAGQVERVGREFVRQTSLVSTSSSYSMSFKYKNIYELDTGLLSCGWAMVGLLESALRNAGRNSTLNDNTYEDDLSAYLDIKDAWWEQRWCKKPIVTWLSEEKDINDHELGFSSILHTGLHFLAEDHPIRVFSEWTKDEFVIDTEDDW